VHVFNILPAISTRKVDKKSDFSVWRVVTLLKMINSSTIMLQYRINRKINRMLYTKV